MRERGMMWDDLRSLIQRNQSHNAIITYYRDKKVNPLNIAVFDRSVPWRSPEGNAFTGYGEDDHWRDSHVCEAAFFGGEIPMEGSSGHWQANECIEKPFRGALGTLEMLLNAGSLRRTDELKRLFARHGRLFPKPPAAQD